MNTTCRYLRVASSFMTCAAPPTFMPVTCEIFSRDDRSWMPTLVTPMGHGALPAHMVTTKQDEHVHAVG